jgi:OTU domain-containing protein 6
MDELLARHRKELRDVEAQVAQKRRAAAATKKKARKAVDADCAALLRHVKERQERELHQALKGGELTAGGGGGGHTTTPTNEDDVDSSADRSGGGDAPPSHIDSKPPTAAAATTAATAATAEPEETQPTSTTVTPTADGKGVLQAAGGGSGGGGSAGANPPRKPNRQKARLARRAAERQADADAAAREAAQLPDLREEERRHMRDAVRALGLAEQEIRPDGHCLYSAAAHQLALARLPLWPPGTTDAADTTTTTSTTSTTTTTTATTATTATNAAAGAGAGEASEEGEKAGDKAGAGAERGANVDAYKVVRQAVARHIRRHADRFAPFLEEPLESYTRKIAETAEWGGHLELTAIAQAYGVTIKVVQGDGRLETIEPSGSGGQGDSSAAGSAIWLAYYRHQYGLGEHYNSLRPAASSATRA